MLRLVSPSSAVRLLSSSSGDAFSASRLVKQLVPESKRTSPPAATPAIGFGKQFSDHMLTCDWEKSSGWKAPEIRPFGDGTIPLHAASSVLHYGIGVFEGLKAYRGSGGEVRLFRPMMNMNRFHRSAIRLALPDFDRSEVLEAIKEYVRVDDRFVISGDGYSAYLRPTMIGTQPTLGVQVPEKAKFFCIISPSGPYYPEGFAPTTLFADKHHVRAFPGGVGDAKCAGNYGPTILPAKEAQAKGFTQVLWLTPSPDGTQHNVGEVGTSNIMVLWKKADGSTELVTPPLDDGTILPGVTRDSLLAVARSWGEFEVSERHFTIEELCDAMRSGRVMEIFGAGTAAVVSPVKGIHYDGVDYPVPVDPKIGAGPYSARFLHELLDIQYGRNDSFTEKDGTPWSIVI